MSHHRALLELASRLAGQGGPGRPRQADLRRAVSTAYYALFHMLVHEATRRFVSGPNREELRQALGRAFLHADMKAVARGFSSGSPIEAMRTAMRGASPSAELRNLANTFVVMQDARHAADYDMGERLSRTETILLVQRVDAAFHDWSRVRKSLEADVFLVALLSQRNMRG